MNKKVARLMTCFSAMLFGALSVQAQHNMHAVTNKDTAKTVEKKAPPYSGNAFAPDGALWSVKLNEKGQLALHSSIDDGQTWLAERLLDTGNDKIKIGGENPPKLVFGPNGVVIILYSQAFAQRFTGEIRMLRSTDHGKSFAAPVTLHQDRQLIGHNYPVIGFDAKGVMHTIWIDARDKAAVTRANLEAEKQGKEKQNYRGVSLYRNVSYDAGASFGPDIKLSDYSCECCRLALSPSGDGGLALMWRHVTAPNIRDHAFMVIRSDVLAQAPTQSSTLPSPVRASFDHWAIDACPHHGPALTASKAGGYHAVWFGVRDDVAQVRYGKLDKDGHPIGKVQALPDTKAEHADILSVDGKVVIAWRSFDGEAMQLRAWISEDDGQHFQIKNIARSTAENGYPQLLTKNGKIYLVWSTVGKHYVEVF